MYVYLGKYKWDMTKKVYWRPETCVNPHGIITGYSGSGKTYTLKKIIKSIISTASHKIEFHIFDVHGDITFDPNICQTIKYSETSPYGINPLVVSTDKDYGGVRKKIRNFISVLNRTSRKLGIKQEAVLINLLRDLYAANGFYEDNPKSWALDYDTRKNKKYPKQYPTISDLEKYANYKLKELIAGGNYGAYKALDNIQKVFKKLKQNAIKQQEADTLLEKYKKEYLDACQQFIDSIDDDTEIDKLIKYDNKDVLKSTYDRIVALKSSGIFKNKQPDFDNNKPIKRYDISSLNIDEQKMFIDIVSEQLFLESKQEKDFEKEDQNIVKKYIVIDEAKRFLTDDENHILNVIINEGRKFGLGFLSASQSITHYPQDILQSTAFKMILGLDSMFYSQASRLLGIEEKRFQYLTPHQTAIVQINSANYKSKFLDIVFDKESEKA